jgi:hypothetical protein
MAKNITIKLTKGGSTIGPFSVYDQFGNLIISDVDKNTLVRGITYVVNDDVTMITIKSTGSCKSEKTVSLKDITKSIYATTKLVTQTTSCLWRHLTNPTLYNSFYGNIESYIIEYPFAYAYQDEVLQNVKDYTKAYKYFDNPYESSDANAKVETDDAWFNKAIIYNGQQCSGILELVKKPLNNMKEYLKYPKYNSDSKSIIFTKSDNFYQYNNFWSVVKNKSLPLFTFSCANMSIDKVLNQTNMDYSTRSFKKEPFRAKEVKVRHILDNRSDAHLVSQFIYTLAQISYK